MSALGLLVSVRDGAEARAALAGGADVVDAKEPRRGALGPVRPGPLRAIAAVVDGRRPLSAALGDGDPWRPDAATRAARRAAGLGCAFVKLGFGGVGTAGAARSLAAAALEGAQGGERRAAVVLVACADWRRAGALHPAALIEVAAETGAAGVLLDTAFKDAPLFDVLPTAAVGAWLAAAHATGLFAALAGGLGGKDFALARELGADLVGVRGAACLGGRTGRVSRARVAELRAAAGAAPAPAPAPSSLVLALR